MRKLRARGVTQLVQGHTAFKSTCFRFKARSILTMFLYCFPKLRWRKPTYRYIYITSGNLLSACQSIVWNIKENKLNTFPLLHSIFLFFVFFWQPAPSYIVLFWLFVNYVTTLIGTCYPKRAEHRVFTSCLKSPPSLTPGMENAPVLLPIEWASSSQGN